jgi:glycosyltransferase involved in cell wall biosynthesis
MNKYSNGSSHHDNPLVSVVMPVYNCARFLPESIGSVLAQTYSNFEFIIIDDGSTDGSASIIKEYTDPRIRFVHNSRNLGLAPSFNIGVREARGQYIARMDADDISRSDRFILQVHYLEQHTDIGLVGSDIRIMNEKGVLVGKRTHPRSPALIKYGALYSNILFHPTVMARADILRTNPYDEHYVKSEDYELWSRLLFKREIHIGNIGKPLLAYRSYAQSTTKRATPWDGLGSAQVIVSNLRIYTPVSSNEEQVILMLRRHEHPSFGQMRRLWQVYARATQQFMRSEQPHIGERIGICFSRIRWGVNLLRSLLQ